jgi:predicted transcriptional regulator
MVAVASSIALPKELVEEIEAAAKETDLSKEVLLRAAVRQYVRANRRWREVQREGAKIAEELGLRTEEEVEAYVEELMDSLEDEV